MFKNLFKKKPPAAQSPPEWLLIFKDFTHDKENCSYHISLLNGDAPTQETVIEFESLIKYKFPAELASFLVSPYSGLYLEVKQEIWGDPEPMEIRPAWAFQNGIAVFSLSDVIPEDLNLRYWHQKLSIEFGISDLVPIITRKGSSVLYCVTPDGGFVEWDSKYPEERRLVGHSFFELLASEMKLLDERRQRFARGEHSSESSKLDERT